MNVPDLKTKWGTGGQRHIEDTDRFGERGREVYLCQSSFSSNMEFKFGNSVLNMTRTETLLVTWI